MRYAGCSWRRRKLLANAEKRSHRLLLGLLYIAIGVVVAAGVPAKTRAQEIPADVSGASLTVYLVTIGQGDAVWQRFGHNAIRILDTADGTDRAFNYGVFDFETPGFLRRFLRGAMLYWLEVHDFPSTVSVYALENRTIWLQELNLTAAERAELLSFLLVNAREENRYYRYDYFRDNCSTRVRDALDRALNGALRAQLSTRGALTYRDETLRLTARNTAINWGMHLGLGPSTDVTLSAWEEAFVPMRLRDHVRNVTLHRADGSAVPLVVDEEVIFEAAREPEPDAAPSMIGPSLVAGSIAAALIVGLGVLARRYRAATVLFALVLFFWSLATGSLGILLGALWIFTDHVAAYGNQNLLQTNPAGLVLALAGPTAVLSGRGRRLASLVAWALAGMSVLGLVLSLLPSFEQATGAIIGLLLPIHLAVALTAPTEPSRPPTT